MTPDATGALARQFRGHFNGEHHLYWHLTKAMADDLDAAGVTARICQGWEACVPQDVVQLRLLAGLFREVLRGDADELIPFYPCLGGVADPAGAWSAARPVLERSVEPLAESLSVAPQTNRWIRSRHGPLVGSTRDRGRRRRPRRV